MSEASFIQELFNRNRKCYGNFPDKELAEGFMDGLFNFLFASYQEKFQTETALTNHYLNLRNTFSALIFELFLCVICAMKSEELYVAVSHGKSKNKENQLGGTCFYYFL